MLAASIISAGCLFFKESSIEKTSTPTAKETAAPTTTVMPTATTENESASNQTNASPTPLPSPSPAAEGGDVKPECTIAINPADAPGPFKSLVAVRFFNYPDPSNVTVKCSAQEDGKAVEKRGEFYYAQCDYPYTFERKILTASASSDFVTCATTVVIQGNPQFAKMWTFSPGDETFSVNQSEEPKTTREYSISNTGTLALTQITCTTDKAWAAPVCPDALANGESKKFKVTYDVSSLAVGENNVQLTITESNLKKDFAIGVTVTK